MDKKSMDESKYNASQESKLQIGTSGRLLPLVRTAFRSSRWYPCILVCQSLFWAPFAGIPVAPSAGIPVAPSAEIQVARSSPVRLARSQNCAPRWGGHNLPVSQIGSDISFKPGTSTDFSHETCARHDTHPGSMSYVTEDLDPGD